MKKPNNKTIAIYLMWVLLHLTLWLMAAPGVKTTEWYESRYKFFPFAKEFSQIEYSSTAFEIDRVYDISEFTFYSIAPIFIYYIITLLKSK